MDQEIEISFVNSKEDVVRNPKTGELVSRVWKTNQRISIRTEDVDKVKRVRNSLKELLADGVYVIAMHPHIHTANYLKRELICSPKRHVMLVIVQ